MHVFFVVLGLVSLVCDSLGRTSLKWPTFVLSFGHTLT